MNYVLYNVDWEWLVSHPEGRARAEAIFSAIEGVPKGKVEDTAIEMVGASSFIPLGETLQGLAAEDFNSSGTLIEVGLLRIMSVDEPATDELGLADVTQGVLFASLSPRSVSEAANACDALDFRALKKAVTENLSDDGDDDVLQPEDFEQLLENVAMALRQANATKRGIIGGCG